MAQVKSRTVEIWVGKTSGLGQGEAVDAEPHHDPFPALVAEEILRKIYGDDFAGCTVRLDDIAAVVADALKHRAERDRGVIEMYEKVVEAFHLLSTPPEVSKVDGPDALRALLSERLDAIHALTTRTIETTSRLRKATGGNG